MLLGCQFCGSNICAFLVKVPFDHGNRLWWVSANLGGREFWPASEVASVDGCAPSRERGRKQGGVIESNAFRQVGVVDHGIGSAGWVGVLRFVSNG